MIQGYLSFLAVLSFSSLGLGLLMIYSGRFVAEVAEWMNRRQCANGQNGQRSATLKRSASPTNPTKGQNGQNGHLINTEHHEH